MSKGEYTRRHYRGTSRYVKENRDWPEQKQIIFFKGNIRIVKANT